MKIIVATLLLAVAVIVSAQNGGQQVTEELQEAQGDLRVGHEFAETLLSLNRGQISSYMYSISRSLISSHIDAYGNMKDQILETNDALDAFEVTTQNEACLNSVRNRWGLQISRFGQRLSACLRVANTMLNAWDRFLLDIHVTGQVTANQVQNLGSKVLAETNVFDEQETYSYLINREFRNLLRLARPYRDRFDEFLQAISDSQDEVVRLLADCDRALEEDLTTEITEDLALAANCVAS